MSDVSRVVVYQYPCKKSWGVTSSLWKPQGLWHVQWLLPAVNILKSFTKLKQRLNCTRKITLQLTYTSKRKLSGIEDDWESSIIVWSLNWNLLTMGPMGQNKVCSTVDFIGEKKIVSGSSQVVKITDIFKKRFQDSWNPEMIMGAKCYLSLTKGKQQSFWKKIQ